MAKGGLKRPSLVDKGDEAEQEAPDAAMQTWS